MPRILLTHSPETRANYYGSRALAGLQALGEVKLHQGPAPLEGEALMAAAAEAGIRITLLDTCYLQGGFGKPPEDGQLRFSDGSAE